MACDFSAFSALISMSFKSSQITLLPRLRSLRRYADAAVNLSPRRITCLPAFAFTYVALYHAAFYFCLGFLALGEAMLMRFDDFTLISSDELPHAFKSRFHASPRAAANRAIDYCFANLSRRLSVAALDLRKQYATMGRELSASFVRRFRFEVISAISTTMISSSLGLHCRISLSDTAAVRLPQLQPLFARPAHLLSLDYRSCFRRPRGR